MFKTKLYCLVLIASWTYRTYIFNSAVEVIWVLCLIFTEMFILKDRSMDTCLIGMCYIVASYLC